MGVARHWRSTEDFQAATLGGRVRPFTLLTVDGVRGRATVHAAGGLPWLSPNFRVNELASKGEDGPLCHVRRELLVALEVTRASLRKPLPIVSAYRSPSHNRAVGGATRSQHVRGLAADLPAGVLSVKRARALGLWSGIGQRRKAGVWWATHVDLRHLTASTSTPAKPALWTYS